eukprot:304993-Pelagomonas_calceolata.AAC.3
MVCGIYGRHTLNKEPIGRQTMILHAFPSDRTFQLENVHVKECMDIDACLPAAGLFITCMQAG